MQRQIYWRHYAVTNKHVAANRLQQCNIVHSSHQNAARGGCGSATAHQHLRLHGLHCNLSPFNVRPGPGLGWLPDLCWPSLRKSIQPFEAPCATTALHNDQPQVKQRFFNCQHCLATAWCPQGKTLLVVAQRGWGVNVNVFPSGAETVSRDCAERCEERGPQAPRAKDR